MWWGCVSGEDSQELWVMAEWALCSQTPSWPFPGIPSACALQRRCPCVPAPLPTGTPEPWLLQGDGGNHILHQLLGKQTTNRLKRTINIKSYSTYLIVEPEWVFRLVGWAPRAFPAFSTRVLSLPLCSSHPHTTKKECWLPVLTWSNTEFEVLFLILIFKLAGTLKLSSLCATAVLLGNTKE